MPFPGDRAQLQTLPRPRTTARNTYRLKGRRPRRHRLIITFIVVLSALLLIATCGGAGILISIGLVGFAATAGLARSVRAGLIGARGDAGRYLFFVWLVITLALCVSFIASGTASARLGHASLPYVGRELARTFVAVGIYALFVAGMLAFRTARG